MCRGFIGRGMNLSVLSKGLLRLVVTGAAAWTTLAAGPHVVQLDSTFSIDEVKWVRERGDASITGKAFLRQRDGTLKDCGGFNVELLPVATYSSERIFHTYGNNRAGQVLLEDNPPTITPDAPGY